MVEIIIEEFKKDGIKEIQLHCSLRNSLGLQFWVKQGFNQILEVECNGNLINGNFGGIKLKKMI